jgi:hypothetical protein
MAVLKFTWHNDFTQTLFLLILVLPDFDASGLCLKRQYFVVAGAFNTIFQLKLTYTCISSFLHVSSVCGLSEPRSYFTNKLVQRRTEKILLGGFFLLFASSILNGTVSNSKYVSLVDCVMNDVFKMKWKKVVMVLFKALSQNFPVEAQDYQLKLQVHSE